MNRRKLAWLALNHLPGAGAVTLRRLAARFGSPEAALEAPEAELTAGGLLTPAQARAGAALAAGLERLEQRAARWQSDGIHPLAIEEPDYPANLRPLRDAPPLLYVRGDLRPGDEVAAAVVGTRSPSPEGARAAQRAGEGLAQAGVTAVSGLALGVDGAAHRGALAAGTCGRAIAVLGGGVDRVTPREHCDLAARVAESGALVSEIPPGARTTREGLLARNRIQAGLARAVIVVQCRQRGGSFTAARRALRAGRPVLAVMWEEPEFAAGVRRLVDMGALAVGIEEAVRMAAQAARLPPAVSDQGGLDFDARGCGLY